MAAFCGQQVVQADKGLLCLLRGPDKNDRRVLCLQNLGPEPCNYGLPSNLFNSAHFPKNWSTPLSAWETRWLAFGGNSPARILVL